jgi:hypothetical protein
MSHELESDATWGYGIKSRQEMQSERMQKGFTIKEGRSETLGRLESSRKLKHTKQCDKAPGRRKE